VDRSVVGPVGASDLAMWADAGLDGEEGGFRTLRYRHDSPQTAEDGALLRQAAAASPRVEPSGFFSNCSSASDLARCSPRNVNAVDHDPAELAETAEVAELGHHVFGSSQPRTQPVLAQGRLLTSDSTAKKGAKKPQNIAKTVSNARKKWEANLQRRLQDVRPGDQEKEYHPLYVSG
jgi:hypothetical protein